MLIERVLMTKELVELQNESNELADNYFPSLEAKQTWFERKHYMVFGDRTPSELYFTKQGDSYLDRRATQTVVAI